MYPQVLHFRVYTMIYDTNQASQPEALVTVESIITVH